MLLKAVLRGKRVILFSFFLTIITACSTTSLPVIHEGGRKPVDYTVIYLIHADANYLYHNQNGEPRQADKKVLREAKWVGKHAKNGEVFIFHLKPETKILYLFPRKDRRFLYYRNGELTFKKNYSPHSKNKAFVTEAKLYQHFHQSENADNKKILLYFGHEIPVEKGTHYYRSRPDASFNTALFAKGVRRFAEENQNIFDLTVLSTCDNGNPLMIQALAPVTNYVLASPLNLHLSHIDTKALHLLEKPAAFDTEKLAAAIAENTYKRLSKFLQTAVSLSLYNEKELKNGLPALATRYKSYIQGKDNSILSTENVDCRLLPFFNPEDIEKGVKTWYKPSRFGKKKGNETFSGWGCKE